MPSVEPVRRDSEIEEFTNLLGIREKHVLREAAQDVRRARVVMGVSLVLFLLLLLAFAMLWRWLHQPTLPASLLAGALLGGLVGWALSKPLNQALGRFFAKYGGSIA